jgi:hypothetical protein
LIAFRALFFPLPTAKETAMFTTPSPSRNATARRSVMRIPAAKPRNPLVAAAARRAAGTHGRGNARQQARRELQRELRSLHPPSL